jgi:HEPN domain-containing protein
MDGEFMSTTPPPEPDAEIVGQWLRKAHDDLAVADVVLATTPSARWAACFHAQQSVEKTMKALLVLRAVDFPKTHSLGYLAGLLGETGDLLDAGAVKSLQQWAVAGRYPEDVPEPTATEATELVTAAHTTTEQLEAVIRTELASLSEAIEPAQPDQQDSGAGPAP